MKRNMSGYEYVRDSRDDKWPVVYFDTDKVTKYWNDTKWFGDQKSTPHCVGYAWSHWLVNYPLVQYVNPTGIYKYAQFVDEWDGEGYEGTSVRAGAKVLRDMGFCKSFRWAQDSVEMANTILTQGPMVVGTTWYEGMDRPDERGYVRPTGQSRGGHAYLVNGVSTINGTFRIKNSWGTRWGRDGRATITWQDMDRLLANGEACIATEVEPTWL